jgi:hypothetical protein
MFFEAERQNFFRPLNGKRRELVAACLRSLYERLHGPGADYSQNLNRDSLRDLLMPIIQDCDTAVLTEAEHEDDEFTGIDSGDALQLAGALIRALLMLGLREDSCITVLNNRHQQVAQAVPVQVLRVVSARAVEALIQGTQAGCHELTPLPVERAKEVLAFGFEEHKQVT